jgi:hypothetical protein
MVRAHRYSWEMDHRQLRPDDELVHICGQRRCVRPDHMELRDPDARRARPTPRQQALIRRVSELGGGRGAIAQAARALGLQEPNAYRLLYEARKRLRVDSTAAALDWLAAQPLDRTDGR